MRPVGLTTKRSRNKYARERDGELMLVHCCTGCGELVLNRIAADDWPEPILGLCEQGIDDNAALATAMAAAGIALLNAQDRALVRRRLFGAGEPLGGD